MPRKVELLRANDQALVVDIDRLTGFNLHNDYTERPGDDGCMVRELTGSGSVTLLFDPRDAIAWEERP